MLRKAALAFTLLLAVLALAACSGPNARAPFADSETPSVAPRFYPPQGWTWGMVKVGDQPAQRYGVSAPSMTARATILILTGYDDPAEGWFETIGALNRRGYVVWLLERAGQGGSARLVGPRDLGHATSFEPDAATVRLMIAAVIRPRRDEPLLILGHSVGGVVALRAVQGGAATNGLILSAPVFEPAGLGDRREAVAAQVRLARKIGLGWLRAPGQGGWRAEGPKDAAGRLTHDPVRASARLAWAAINPELRMGGPSLGWLAALFDAADAAGAAAPKTPTPTVMITGGDDSLADTVAARRLCAALPACAEVTVRGAWHDLPREADPARGVWLDTVDAFARRRIAAVRR